MNATFEKWYADKYPTTAKFVERNSPSAIRDHHISATGWQAAIASLEVTPELVGIVANEIADLLDAYATDDDCKSILTCVFAKLRDPSPTQGEK